MTRTSAPNGGRRTVAIVALLLLLGAAAAAVFLTRDDGEPQPGGSSPPDGLTVTHHQSEEYAAPASPYPARVVALELVSNASGMVVTEQEGRIVVATVDEVPEWEGDGKPPPLINFSDPRSGKHLGGSSEVGAFGEIEALALKDGRIVFPYKTGAQRVVLRDGERDIVLVDEPVISALTAAANQVQQGQWFFEFEGLAWTGSGWEFVVAALFGTADNGPANTRAVYRARFGPEGGLTWLSPPLRREDGQLRTDYAAALHVLPDGRALIPGFFEPNVFVYDAQGHVARTIEVDTRRIEGIHWNPTTRELYLVRECYGPTDTCAEGIHFGVPLTVLTLPKI